MRKLSLSVMLVVILILTTSCSGTKDEIIKAKNMMKEFEISLEMFVEYHNRYPTTEEGLVGVIKHGEFYKSKTIPLDPWKKKFVYTSNSDFSYTLKSLGPDGKEGGEEENADIVFKKENKERAATAKKKAIKKKPAKKSKKKYKRKSKKRRRRKSKKRRR